MVICGGLELVAAGYVLHEIQKSDKRAKARSVRNAERKNIITNNNIRMTTDHPGLLRRVYSRLQIPAGEDLVVHRLER